MKNNCFPIQFGHLGINTQACLSHSIYDFLKMDSDFSESNQEINPARPKPFLKENCGCVDVIEALIPPPDFGAKSYKFCIFKFTKGR